MAKVLLFICVILVVFASVSECRKARFRHDNPANVPMSVRFPHNGGKADHLSSGGVLEHKIPWVSDHHSYFMAGETSSERMVSNLGMRWYYRPFAVSQYASVPQNASQISHQLLNSIAGYQDSGTGGGLNIFAVNYVGTVPDAVKDCITAATLIWSSVIATPLVPITVDVHYTSLPSGVLGATGPRYMYLFAGHSAYYPDSLANQMVGHDLDPSSDITLTLNSAQSHWNTDITILPPQGTYDMTTVVLHELVHGLGFAGLFGSASTKQYHTAYPMIYDQNVVFGDGTIPWKLSPNLLSTMTNKYSNNLYFSLDQQQTLNVKLYDPNPWRPGSSFYHTDESTYESVDPLMTPILNQAERILGAGPYTLGMLSDLGWSVHKCDSYGNNCASCVQAGCTWCGDSCLDSVGAGDSCYPILSADQCDPCYTDNDCNDANNACNWNSCDTTTGTCKVTLVIDCSDADPCTLDICDSGISCIHHSAAGCDSGYSTIYDPYYPDQPVIPCSNDPNASLFSHGYLCKNPQGEKLAIAKDPILSVQIGTQIPAIPANFFSKKSVIVGDTTLSFTWCDSTAHYASVFRITSVEVNTTSTQITNLMATYIHLCSTADLVVQQSGSTLTSRWSVELVLSGNSKFTLAQKSQGYMAFKFTDDQTVSSSSSVYLQIVPRIIFTNTGPKGRKVVRILDYNTPSKYYMPFITLVDGYLAAFDMNSFAGSFQVE